MVAKLRDMGQMTVTDTGLFQWSLAAGDIVALQHFLDNLMVATKGPTQHSTVYTVCKTIESIWDLQVLCPWRDKNRALVCRGACMSSTVHCMGVSICVSRACSFAHTHPNAHDDVWRL